MKEINEKLLEFVNETKGKTIIVEGRHDKEALKIIGVSAKNIVAINGRPLLNVANEIIKKMENKDNEVIILTDFDPKGKLLAAKLTRLLQAHKIQPNPRLRKMFIGFGRHQIEDIKYAINSRNRRGGNDYVKTSTNFNKIYNKSEDKSKRSNRKARCDRGNIRSDRRLARLRT